MGPCLEPPSRFADVQLATGPNIHRCHTGERGGCQYAKQEQKQARRFVLHPKLCSACHLLKFETCVARCCRACCAPALGTSASESRGETALAAGGKCQFAAGCKTTSGRTFELRAETGVRRRADIRDTSHTP